MADWIDICLGEFLELKRGYDLPSNQRSPGPYPLISSSGPSDFHSEARVKGPGVITGRYGTIGNVFFVENDYWPLNTTLYVRDFKGNNPRFIYYLLTTLNWQKFNDKSSVPGVNRNDAHREPIRVPQLSDQKAIASVLSALDDKIDLNCRMNKTLETIARATFKEWFVDFGPVRAKAEGHQPPGLCPNIAALFPDKLDNEGKPAGWAWKTLSQVARDIRRGISPSYAEKGGVLVLNQKCIRNGKIYTDKARRHNSAVKSIEDRLLSIGDIVVNSTGVGTLGRVAQVWQLPEPSTIVDSHVTMIRAENTVVFPSYLGYNLTGRELEIEALGEGSTGQTELARARLGELAVLIPSQSLQEAFDRLIRPLVERIVVNDAETHSLAALRDLLLPKLMSGETRVREAEKVLEDTL
jgi:type I restriction enzyme, S subunit